MDFTSWAAHAPSTDFWLLTGLLGIIGLVSLVQAFVFLLRKRVIEDIPTSRIRSAAQGYVELEGRGELMSGPPVLAPLTGSRCLWYEYSIQEHRGSGKNRRWVSVESGRSSDLFLLIDGTGQCVIDPDGARVTASVTDKWYGPNRDSRLKTTGGRWLIFGARFRFREARLQPGDPLYAIGLFETVGGAGTAADHQTRLRALLSEWKADTELLLERFDQNRDGEICLEEWEQVRAVAWQEVLKQHAELQAAEPVHMMGETRDRRWPYLLSATPQFDLVKRYRTVILLLLIAALGSGTAASFLITSRLTG